MLSCVKEGVAPTNTMDGLCASICACSSGRSWSSWRDRGDFTWLRVIRKRRIHDWQPSVDGTKSFLYVYTPTPFDCR